MEVPEMKPIKAMEWSHSCSSTTGELCQNKQCVLVEMATKSYKYISLICPVCFRELKYE